MGEDFIRQLTNLVEVGGVKFNVCGGLTDGQGQLPLPQTDNKLVAATIHKLVLAEIVDQVPGQR